jgi:hypothetical protein
MSEKHCAKARKRKYSSEQAALRAGTQRYGTTSNAYRCQFCKCWHLTRRGVPVADSDPHLERLVDAALGKGRAS